MTILRILSAAAVLTAGAVSAQAADLTYEPAPVAAEIVPVGNWTGFYLGGSIGYGWGKTDQKPDADGDIITYLSASDVLKPDGFIAGVQLGGDYQFPSNIVIGALVDVYYSNAKDTYLDASGFDYGTTESHIEYFGTARARVGYAVDKFLPYVTGGLAWANNKIDDQFYGSDSQTHFGWTLGAGVEYQFATNWTLKAEYLYSDYGSKTYSFTSPFVESFDVGLKSQTATVGVNYRF